jgi:TolB-like protein
LLIGLPVVVVISLAREEVYGDEVAAADAGVAAAEDRRLRLLTWRTAGLSLVGAMALWGVIAAGLLLTGKYEPATASQRFFSAAASNSVAVLPFVNASGDTASDYLAEGLTVELINTLARLPELRVIPRASAFHYRGEPFEPEKVARELGVNVAVTGTVAQHGAELFISIELVDLRDNDQLWGRRYERTMQDIFDIEEEIVASIVEGLGLPLTGARAERLSRRYTQDAEAYQLYLRGRHLSQWGSSTANWTKAIEYFERAIARDSSFALAYAAMPEVYFYLAFGRPPREVFPKARAAAEAALKIDDTLAEAHAAGTGRSESSSVHWSSTQAVRWSMISTRVS